MRILHLLCLVGVVYGHGTYVDQRVATAPGQVRHRQYQQYQSAPGSQYYRLSPDGSYDFGYDTSSGSYKTEQKSRDGQVQGNYGHTNPDGSYTNVQYQAEGGGGGDYGVGGSTLYRDDYYGTGRGGTYQAVQYGHTLPVQPGRSSETAQVTYDRSTDGSYNLNVQARDQSRVESGSPAGEVRGGYSFVGTDGVQRSVSYTAGAQGFQAVGDHLPRDSNTVQHQRTYSSYTGTRPAVPAPSVQRPQTYVQRPQAYGPRPQTTYNTGYQTASTQYRRPAGSTYPGRNYVAPSSVTYKGGQAHRTSGYGNDGYYDGSRGVPKPFSFSYNAGDHGRQETQDASGVVRGSYIVNNADGTQKELTYQADDDGFRVVDEKVVGGTGSYVQTGRTAAAGAGYQAAGHRYQPGIKYKPKSIQAGANAY